MAKTNPAQSASPLVAPAAISVRVLFFASLADLMGERRRSLHLPAGSTVGDALRDMALDVPNLAARAPHVSFAVNESFVSADAPLSDGDELALIPPVSGG